MKLHFESNLDFQLEAIDSAVRLFEGQEVKGSDFEYAFNEANSIKFREGIGNRLLIDESQILKNLQQVQARNGLRVSESLASLDFSIEMETGTGKTYVYLRTIFELNAKYGFKKFVIVVPSIAIREGVLKNLEITKPHFQMLYENTSVHFQVYDSSKISALRGFASGNNIEIMVINIDSFTKDENIINRPNDKLNGLLPLSFISSVRPIVIIDEPQNMESEKRRQAISKLNSLCTLRYSATHKSANHIIYSLNPVDAYNKGLVKQIEVDSIIEENSGNDAFVSLDRITATKTKITARLTILVNEKNGVKKKAVTVRAKDDLYSVSNKRESYKDGFIVEEIDAQNGYLTFSNGTCIQQGQTQGALTEELMRVQMHKTIEEHLNKELKLRDRGIKVLSLFFIDKVSNYRGYGPKGEAEKGKFALWFEEIYRELCSKERYSSLAHDAVEELHNGYFSQDPKGRLKDSSSGETIADNDTYSLIMRDKEKLLSLSNPLRFIFSHSALREGWDNPNVFQICTLNESKSEMKKRQEIGRGLRLAVDSGGKRIYDRDINRLTVIANESYTDFANALQQEIKDDCGVEFTGAIKNKKKRVAVKYRKGFELDPLFLDIWKRIKDKTSYRVSYDTNSLIDKASKAIKEMPVINSPSIRSTKVAIEMNQKGLESRYLADSLVLHGSYQWAIPDILSYLQSKTELTRHTLSAILKRSGRIDSVLINPQLFLDLSAEAIRRCLHELMIEGIKYEKIEKSEYEMRLFEAQELEIYLNKFSFEPNDSSKTIYEGFMPLDSDTESQFAKDCESSEQVKFYFKLPNWFKIPTPIGNYNPDWAIVFDGESRVYFVAETKATGDTGVDLSMLRDSERQKISCGKAHFEQFDEVEYKVVSKVSELI